VDALDLVLLVAVIGFAVSGYRQGFVVGVLSLVGFVGGGLLGAQLAPPLARGLGLTADGGRAPGFGLIAVVAFAVVGQVVTAAVGAFLRRRLVWHPLRALDSAAGALVSVVSVLLVAWGLARVVVQTDLDTVKRQVRDSRVLNAVDALVPTTADQLLASLLRLVDSTGFPKVFSGLDGERIVPAAPPDPAVLGLPGVRAASASIVKVTGSAPSCSRRVEGTGFLYAPERVMTNAHVVAGVARPQVQVGAPGATARVLDATVVLYDPQRDLAVLRVPGIGGRPLVLDDAPESAGADGAVAGYPQNGPFDARPARVRARQQIVGPDIYGSSQVRREVYVLYAVVRPGNSGGPFLDPQGRVDGVVFAASTQDPQTGYALTAAEVLPDARAGRTATGAVSTLGCD